MDRSLSRTGHAGVAPTARGPAQAEAGEERRAPEHVLELDRLVALDALLELLYPHLLNTDHHCE